MGAETKWAIIGRGQAGWHAVDTTGSVWSSGGDLNPYTYWTGEKCKGYAQEAIDGCIVYEAGEVPIDQFIDHVYKGPMADPGLDPEQIRAPFGENRQDDGQTPIGALDFVGLGVYLRLLRALPGIKIGFVRAGAVEWEAQS